MKPFIGCCTADSQTDAGRHQLYNNGSLVLFFHCLHVTTCITCMAIYHWFSFNNCLLSFKVNKKSGEAGPVKQTDPPTRPIAELFPDGNFPEGEITEYADIMYDGRTAKERFGSEVKQYLFDFRELFLAFALKNCRKRAPSIERRSTCTTRSDRRPRHTDRRGSSCRSGSGRE